MGKRKPWEAPRYQARMNALKRAAASTGTTAEARLGWVVRAVRDPVPPDPGLAAELGDGLHALALGFFVPSLKWIDNPLPPPLTRRQVVGLHRDIKTMLRRLVTGPPGQPVMVPSRGQTFGLVRATAVGVLPAIFGTTRGQATARVAILRRVADLVLQAGQTLLACRGCGAPFLKVHRQRYCTPACSQRHRNRARKARERAGLT